MLSENRQKPIKTDKKPTKKPTKNRENRQMSVFKIIEFQKPTNVGSKYFVSVAILGQYNRSHFNLHQVLTTTLGGY